MSKEIENYRQKLHQYLIDQHANQFEFHQVAKEISNDIFNHDDEYSPLEVYNFFRRTLEPDRTIRFKVEWFDDQEKLQVNRGWRIQFNNVLGAYKGGLRFHPSVNESIFKFLGYEQTFKNALIQVPMGGAKGGSDFSSKGKSNHEIMRFCQSFMDELYRHIGPDTDIPAGDIGVGTKEIGYLYGHYIKISNQYVAALTGKHPNFGGSSGREEATGHGCVYLLQECLKEHSRSLNNKKVLVSGAGNVALYAVEKLIEFGANVLTVSDSHGLLYFKDGITRKDLQEIKILKFDKNSPLSEFIGKNTQYIKNKKPWSIAADIAIPAATQHEITLDDSKELVKNGVQVIIEASNMPLTHQAIENVTSNNILFIPGKVANAGGVAVSGLERYQNSTHSRLTAKQVDKQLNEIMSTVHKNSIMYIHKENGLYPYQRGANIYSFKRLYSTLRNLKG